METLKFVFLSFVQTLLGVSLIVAGGGYLLIILIITIKILFIDDPSIRPGLDAASGLFMFLIFPLASIMSCSFGYGFLKAIRENWISLKKNKGKSVFYSG